MSDELVEAVARLIDRSGYQWDSTTAKADADELARRIIRRVILQVGNDVRKQAEKFQ